MDNEQAWRTQLLQSVINGNSGDTATLVIAALNWNRFVLDDQEEIFRHLENTTNSASRNRRLRGWLCKREQLANVLRCWVELGFPNSPNYNHITSAVVSVDPPTAGVRASEESKEKHSFMVVIDFDQCLASAHVGSQHLDNVVDLVFGGRKRLTYIKQMISSLSQTKGLVIGILSMNMTTLLKDCLTSVGLSPQFIDPQHVIGYDKYGFSELQLEASKSEEINSRWLPHCSKILFVDDRSSNIEDVRKNCPSNIVSTLHVTSANGMTESDCAKILRWAKSLP
eukprot:m.265849 g.265849  ORF g.265849 m.265849 type:complete len:282 (-) comp64083_c0_seq1:42-887(-)